MRLVSSLRLSYFPSNLPIFLRDMGMHQLPGCRQIEALGIQPRAEVHDVLCADPTFATLGAKGNGEPLSVSAGIPSVTAGVHLFRWLFTLVGGWNPDELAESTKAWSVSVIAELPNFVLCPLCN